MGNDETIDKSREPGWKRVALRVAEVLLVLIIIGLLVAIWLPAYIGASPSADR